MKPPEFPAQSEPNSLQKSLHASAIVGHRQPISLKMMQIPAKSSMTNRITHRQERMAFFIAFLVFLLACMSLDFFVGYMGYSGHEQESMMIPCSAVFLQKGSGRKKKSVEPSAYLRTGSGKAYMSK